MMVKTTRPNVATRSAPAAISSAFPNKLMIVPNFFSTSFIWAPLSSHGSLQQRLHLIVESFFPESPLFKVEGNFARFLSEGSSIYLYVNRPGFQHLAFVLFEHPLDDFGVVISCFYPGLNEGCLSSGASPWNAFSLTRMLKGAIRWRVLVIKGAAL